MDLLQIKGVGAVKKEALIKLGITDIRQLVYYLPRSYKDFSRITPLAQAEDHTDVLIKARITSGVSAKRIRNNITLSTVSIVDDYGTQADCIWFYKLFNKFNINDVYYFCGKVIKNGRFISIHNSLFEKNRPDKLMGLKPVYRINTDITQNSIREIIKNAFVLYEPEETLPESIRNRYKLLGIKQALKALHFPVSTQNIEDAKRRMAFEELLIYQSAITSLIQKRKGRQGFSFNINDSIKKEFTSLLNYTLTGAQLRAIEEISSDMAKQSPMNRIVQGDVGCGKTIVALYALFVASRNGKQSAFIAPTEILAKQHFAEAQKIFGSLDIKTALLTGNMSQSEKKEILTGLKDGSIQIIIGTHAVLQESVEFKDLGLAVTDEQHRFGVRQRAAISAKGDYPDLLVMSATPIPRTLSLSILGDLDISIIDEMPAGRKPVKTRCVPNEKIKGMYSYVNEQIKQGRQGYIVCPLIEDSEDIDAHSATEVYKELKSGMLKNVRLGLLHSDIDKEEKERLISDFKDKKLDVLVSTIVIEVGVNVPNASFMIIYDAGRFGLAQLHQLRGRVGRGEQESYCFLLNDNDSALVQERLKIICSSNDGFEIAQKDMELRDPGDVIGLRQSGAPLLDIAAFYKNEALASDVNDAVQLLFYADGYEKEKAKVLELVNKKYHEKLDEIILN